MSTYNIIKVNATKSTNDKVKMLIKSKKINNLDIISAKYQYKGRGQQNNRWFSSYGNNLLCSLYLKLPNDFNSPLFTINFAATLSVLDTIRFFNDKKSFIKWPNDILADNNKISGILIENNFKNNFINYSFWVILVSFICALISITFWTFVGKFFRRFATNEKFIKIFNYAMATLLLACIGTFYL